MSTQPNARSRISYLAAALLLTATASLAQDAPDDAKDESSWWTEARKLYEKAKEAGEDVPGNVRDWVAQDYENIGTWEYKVETVSGASAAALEELLNTLGKERWECFHVSREKKETTLFLRRQAESYLKSIPVSTLLKLVLGSSDESG